MTLRWPCKSELRPCHIIGRWRDFYVVWDYLSGCSIFIRAEYLVWDET